MIKDNASLVVELGCTVCNIFKFFIKCGVPVSRFGNRGNICRKSDCDGRGESAGFIGGQFSACANRSVLAGLTAESIETGRTFGK